MPPPLFSDCSFDTLFSPRELVAENLVSYLDAAVFFDGNLGVISSIGSCSLL